MSHRENKTVLSPPTSSDLFSTFGTPHEVTLADLSIETFYPADPESEKLLNDEMARLKTKRATETTFNVHRTERYY
jgi:hypothetical protein